VLYHALSGVPPYHEITTLVGLIFAMASTPPRLSPACVAGVPHEVVSLVHGALELDPAQRFPSAAAMLDAIRPLLPGGWSLDEGMLAPPAGEPGPEEAPAPRPLDTAGMTDPDLLDEFADTRPEPRRRAGGHD
jgi:serine/threonine-protein kinase